MEILVPVFIILILILLNGLFVAAEFALVTAPRPKLRRMKDDGSKKAAQLLEILSSQELQNRYITTAQVGITIASLGLGMYGEHVIAEWLLEPLHRFNQMSEALAHTVSTILSVSLLTYLHVVLGEMIPKSFALHTASQTAIVLYTPLNISEKIFSPIVHILNKISVAIIKALDLSQNEDDTRILTSDDLEFVVEESMESGFLESTDQLFIENILDLDERTARQIMTPRNRIYAISITTPPEKIIEMICDTNKTRYPIIDSTLDNILGVLHIKDLARWQVKNNGTPDNIKELLRPTIFVPESLPLSKLLYKFRNAKSHVAIALDEFGGTSGIITLEDLIEEVVGEILDEFDHETPPFEMISEGLIRVRGDVILEELEQHFNLVFEDTYEAISIGGYIMSELGSIPQPNDQLHIDGVTITVEKVDGLAINSILIQLPEKNDPQNTQ
jgi:CBS domain containing-hemolysin-like protein